MSNEKGPQPLPPKPEHEQPVIPPAPLRPIRKDEPVIPPPPPPPDEEKGH